MLSYPKMQIFIPCVYNYNIPTIADNFFILFYSLI